MSESSSLEATTAVSVSDTSLGTIPPEIIAMVCTYLPQSDLAAFRLAGSRYAVIGETEICRTLHVMLTIKSLQNMLHIARHPTLGSHVSTIFCEATKTMEGKKAIYYHSVRKYLRKSHLEALLSSKIKITTVAKIFKDGIRKKCADGWETYKQARNDQEYLERTHYDTAAFGQAMASFKNLRCIKMNTSNNSNVPPETFKLAHGFMQSFDNFRFMEESRTAGIGRRLLAQLLRSVPTPSKIERLDIRSTDFAFFEQSPKGLSPYQPVFSQLRWLRLQTTSLELGDARKSPVQQKELGNLLRHAVNLESFGLTVDEPYGNAIHALDERNRAIFVTQENIFADHTWEKLRSLELSCITASEAAMSSFLRRHKSTLKVLKMDCMWLTTAGGCESWDGVLSLLREELELEDVKLTGVWGADMAGHHSRMYNMYGKWVEHLAEAIKSKSRTPVCELIPSCEITVIDKFYFY